MVLPEKEPCQNQDKQSASFEKKPFILAVGDTEQYNTLFDRINEEFASNKKYINSPNKLNILKENPIVSENGFERNCIIKIATKYYEFDVGLVILSQQSFVENLEKLMKESLEGILLLVNPQNLNHYNDDHTFLECLLKTLKYSESCFRSIITDRCDQTSKQNFLGKFESVEDLIQIDLTEAPEARGYDSENEEIFTDLDELINSLFVHSWSDMIVKDEQENITLPKTSVEQTRNDQLLKSDSEDQAFNFEDLLTNLSEYKAKAEELGFEERKRFAEDVVLKFWKSIGGDQDEIND